MHLHPVNRKHHEGNTWSVRFAEKVTLSFGSMRYIVIQTVGIACWITLNMIGFMSHWDAYPFILLNLVFSTQAAYAAPLILLGQNRQGEKDRQMAEYDFRHNSEALALLRAWHADAHGADCTQCFTLGDS
jgi:uncharacterized membrane protein